MARPTPEIVLVYIRSALLAHDWQGRDWMIDEVRRGHEMAAAGRGEGWFAVERALDFVLRVLTTCKYPAQARVLRARRALQDIAVELERLGGLTRRRVGV